MAAPGDEPTPADGDEPRQELGRRPSSVRFLSYMHPRVILARGLVILLLSILVGLIVLARTALVSGFGDLYGGLAVIGLLAGWLFWLGLLVGRRVSRRTATLLVLPGLAAIALHSFVLLDEPRLAWLLPVSNLVVVGNWTPLAVGWEAGLAWRHIPKPVWRKLLFVVPLLVVAAWHGYGWLLGAPPACSDFEADGVVLQTSPATCSAASAATLLRAHGIVATEREMARLCLTRSWGTTRLGLYRGLKRKTAGTPYDVEVFQWTLDELRARPPGPVILHVVLERGATSDKRYVRDWGWEVGRPHAVILFRFLPNDLVEMGDPSIGREPWHVDSLRVLWHGDGMRLVK